MRYKFSILASAMPLLCVASTKPIPNVIIIYVDDMGIGDLSVYGGPYSTPNIDTLASQGMIFNQYYSASPVSSSSRTALITGNFNLRHGINTFLSARKHNAACEQRDYLESNVPSMPRAFKNAGYMTAHIGKWHLGGGRDVDNAPSIKEYGYDEYLSTYESPDPDPKITASNWIWSPEDEIKRWDRTRYFVDNALKFIDNVGDDEPFFINLWLDDMHTPWVPNKKYYPPKNKKQNKEGVKQNKQMVKSEPAFELVLTELDNQIGRFMDELNKRELTENTIVIFTSDNGPSPGFRGKRTTWLRGTKNCLYEGGIRMPFIVRYPNCIEAGQLNNDFVLSAVDLYPTLCGLAGISTETIFDGDGGDYKAVFYGDSSVKRNEDLMWDFGRNSSFNSPENKNDKSPHLAIRRGDWKLLVNSDGSDIQLYNLLEDVVESKNLAGENNQLVKTLSEKVILWYNSNKN